MAQNLVKFLIRRGTDADRKTIILSDGELGITTDNASRRLFVGDGERAGGWPVGTKFYIAGSFSDVNPIQFVQPGDLVYVIGLSGLYALSGSDNSSSDNYLKIT